MFGDSVETQAPRLPPLWIWRTATQAAPTNFSQRGVADEAALARVFDRFERWQTLRVVLQVLNFGAMLWALVAYVSAS